MRTKKKISHLEDTGERRKGISAGSERIHAVEKPAVQGEIPEEKNMTERTAAANSPVRMINMAESLCIQKEPVKSSNLCKVTFRLPAEAASNAERVAIVGDFNDWSQVSTPLRKLENGDFTVTIELATGREYRFRYLIDGQRWENDWHADKYLKSPYGVEDSVVCV